MIADGYYVTLQCDFCPPDMPPHVSNFYGYTEKQAYDLVRGAGWRTYSSQHKAKCPDCVKSQQKASKK